MKMNLSSLENRAFWENAGVKLPEFSIETMRANTRENPVWVHFGAGNIFRAFIARLQQRLLNEGKADRGIIAVDTFDYDILDKIYAPYDNLTMLVLMNADGRLDKEIVASISEGLKGGQRRWHGLYPLKGDFPQAQPADDQLYHHGEGLCLEEPGRGVFPGCGPGYPERARAAQTRHERGCGPALRALQSRSPAPGGGEHGQLLP